MNGVRIAVRDQGLLNPDQVHARLLIERAGEWVICGVCQLKQQEWNEFSAWAKTHAVEIVYEQANTVQADIPDAL